MTDAAGVVVDGSVTKYYPFGSYRERPTTNPTTTTLGFTGHRHDDGAGLIYANARYYLPQVGRFASADTLVPEPANPQSFNRYSYVYNRSPIMRDPDGRTPRQVPCILSADDCVPVPSMWRPLFVRNNNQSGVFGRVVAYGAGFVPYLDTGDDVLTAFTGCGYACRAGYEDPATVPWRIVSGMGIVLPFGFRSLRTVADVLDELGSAVRTFDDDILESLIAETGPSSILFRGLEPGDPRLQDFLDTGVVYPRGGQADLWRHAAGETASPFTSWTVDLDEARRHATDREGNLGAILWVDLNQINNEAYATFQWGLYSVRHGGNELEITTQGPVWFAQLFDWGRQRGSNWGKP